jgi:ABC-type lipoprotein export system ATPase subunit
MLLISTFPSTPCSANHCGVTCAVLQVYPATLFTSAPLPVLREALRAAAGTQDTANTATEAAYADNSSSSNTVTSVLPDPYSSTRQPQQQQPHGNQPLPLPLTLQQQGQQQQPLLQQCPHSRQPLPLPLQQQGPQQQQLLLSCTGLSLSTPSGVPVVRDLTLQVSAGSSLLIQGPSGCGKSTLVSCLAGLWPLQSGDISILGRVAGQGSNLDFLSAAGGAAGGCAFGGIIERGSAADGGAGGAGAAGGVMFVPQRPLAAPGVTLRQQLLYPAAASTWPCSCTCSSSSSSSSRAGDSGRHAQQDVSSGRRQREQQQQQQQQRQWGISHSWWLNWLSCGLHKQHQQQQQRHFLHTGAPAMQTTTSSRPSSLTSQKQLQQQLSLPPLPPQPPLWQQQHVQSPGPQQHQQLPGPRQQLPGPLQQQLPGSQQQQQLLGPQQQLGLEGLCPSCQHLASILHCVGLSYLLAAHPLGLHSRHEAWGDVLSPGELQRIAFARVLLHRPTLAVLDEATSALPAAAAVELYRQLVGAGVSFVSVGHSSCLVGVHGRVLSVTGDGCGGWQLS